MTADLFSPSWPRVAALRPKLRAHAQIHRHVYRGVPAYVLQDRASRRSHHFNAAAHELIGLLDGARTVDEAWRLACERLGDEAPSQEETIRLLAQLHTADLLQSDVPPDLDELLRRAARQRKNRLVMALLSPLSMKIPFFDPERFLERTLPFYAPLFGRIGFAIWLLAVIAGATLMGLHWSELSSDVTDRVLAPHNLVMLALVFPLLKALHEMGHACAVRRWGGEVHEMGVMLLVLFPIPYVDASSASAFRSTRERVIVGAAGMMVELFVAALAMLVWVNAEPGVVRSIAYNLVFIAGVSTLLFNANPLMRLDGYYILADLIEIPNLRLRASREMLYLAERHLFGMKDGVRPSQTSSERAWLVAFAVASFFYRFFIAVLIAFFIAGKYFVIGLVLAMWSVLAALLLPLVRAGLYLVFAGRLQGRRARVGRAVGVAVAMAALLLFVVPVPFYTMAEGVVWVPRQAIVVAASDGFVEKVSARAGDTVRPGDPIVTLTEPALPAQILLLQAKLDELQARYDADRPEARVRSEMMLDEVGVATAELARAREREANLVVKSPIAGRLVLPRAEDLPGQFMRQGSNLGFVIDGGKLTARVVVAQQDADLVRSSTVAVAVKPSYDLSQTMVAMVLREVPAASTDLPSLALSTEGGGKAALDPRERNAARALQKFFEFELQLPESSRVELGARVYVRFEHGWKPIGLQWYRNMRQLFLRRLNV